MPGDPASPHPDSGNDLTKAYPWPRSPFAGMGKKSPLRLRVVSWYKIYFSQLKQAMRRGQGKVVGGATCLGWPVVGCLWQSGQRRGIFLSCRRLWTGWGSRRDFRA